MEMRPPRQARVQEQILLQAPSGEVPRLTEGKSESGKSRQDKVTGGLHNVVRQNGFLLVGSYAKEGSQFGQSKVTSSSGV